MYIFRTTLFSGVSGVLLAISMSKSTYLLNSVLSMLVIANSTCFLTFEMCNITNITSKLCQTPDSKSFICTIREIKVGLKRYAFLTAIVFQQLYFYCSICFLEIF